VPNVSGGLRAMPPRSSAALHQDEATMPSHNKVTSTMDPTRAGESLTGGDAGLAAPRDRQAVDRGGDAAARQVRDALWEQPL
jgi:hypothetical protein